LSLGSGDEYVQNNVSGTIRIMLCSISDRKVIKKNYISYMMSILQQPTSILRLTWELYSLPVFRIVDLNYFTSFKSALFASALHVSVKSKSMKKKSHFNHGLQSNITSNIVSKVTKIYYVQPIPP
jgi:hypothetical protein